MGTEKVKWHIVKVGNLYYSQGLRRINKENKDVRSYEFVSDVRLAFIFPIGAGFAEGMAKQINGNVEELLLSVDESIEQRERLDIYIESENEWKEKSHIAILDEFHNAPWNRK